MKDTLWSAGGSRGPEWPQDTLLKCPRVPPHPPRSAPAARWLLNIRLLLLPFLEKFVFFLFRRKSSALGGEPTVRGYLAQASERTHCIFKKQFTCESVKVPDKAAITYAFLPTRQGENNRINIIYFIMISVYTSRVHKKRPFHQANCLKVKERELQLLVYYGAFFLITNRGRVSLGGCVF